MVAALMGIANDDVLYFILVFRRGIMTQSYAESLSSTVHRSGAAIIQTTLILAAGIATFYMSRFILLGRAAFVVTIALIAASATTLLVVPAILRLSRKLLERARARGSDGRGSDGPVSGDDTAAT
jgi:predicted RND superfamily exporter protein